MLKMTRRVFPVFLLLALHVSLLTYSAWRQSATVDELNHLATGLYSLSNLDFRCNRLSPPLQNMICALPVMLFGDYRLTYDHAYWKKGIWNGLGERFVEANPHTFHRNLMIGRCGTIFLSVLLCFLVYQWAYELWGYVPALGVLSVTVWDPNLLAHGSLTTADTAPTLFFLLAGYLTWHFVQKPTWKRLLMLGVVFGLTWSSKHSGLVLFPAWFLIFVILYRFHSQPIFWNKIPGFWGISVRTRPVALAVGFLGMIAMIGGFTIWGVYGFEVGDKVDPPRIPKDSQLWSTIQVPLQTATYLLGFEERFAFRPDDVNDPCWKMLRNWMPAFSHWEGFFRNRKNASIGGNTFFLGQNFSRVKYGYYPLLFLFKTPVALLILYLVGILVCLRGGVRMDFPTRVVALSIPLAYLFFLIGYNRAFIGYRHALPVIPYMLVFLVGATMQYLWKGIRRHDGNRFIEKGIGRFLFWGLLGWMAMDVYSVSPHFLAYYNPLAGGPDGGNRIAVDSNLDWGQGLFSLKDYLQEHDLDDAFLIYFGPETFPRAYGISYRQYRSQGRLQPGTYIISATMLRQYITPYFLPELLPLATRHPDEIITHTLWVFHVK